MIAPTRLKAESAARDMTDSKWSSSQLSPKSIAGTALLGKACDVVDIIGRSPGQIGAADLMARTGIPRATLYRILAALTSRGLVRLDPASQSYTLGFSFLELAQNAWSSSDLAAIASVELRRLRDLTGETTYLAVQEGNRVLALGRFEGAHSERSNARLGALKPMHCTSQGKSILAHLPDGVVAELVQGDLQRFTPNTIESLEQLTTHLSIVRARGYAIDDEEIVLGTRCVGAAVLNAEGKPIAAISVAGPAFRVTRERAEQLGQELLEAARRISGELAPSRQARSSDGGNVRNCSATPAFVGATPRWSERRRAIVWADLLAPAIRVGGEADPFVPLHALSEGINSFCLIGDGVVCSVGGDVVSVGANGIRRRYRGPAGRAIKTLRADPGGAIWAAEVDALRRTTRIGRWNRTSGTAADFEIQGEVFDFVFTAEDVAFAVVPSSQTIYRLETLTGRKRKFSDIPRAAGAPMALAIDEMRDVWVALADGWSVVKLNASGEIVRTIALPVPRPTGLSFGGDGMTELFVTSDRSSLGRESLANAPLSGHLLSIDVGERGIGDWVAKL